MSSQLIQYIYKVIALLLITILLIACGSEQSTKKQLVTVDVIKVVPQKIPIYKKYIGTTKAVSSVYIRARVDGFLVERNYKEGDYVDKGKLLYIIDKRPYEVSLAIAKAKYLEQKANAAFLISEEQRYANLVTKNVVSKEKYDQIKAQAQGSIAAVAADKANIASAELNLSYASMYAPISGKIGETLINVGNYVSGSSESKLALLVQLDPIYVEFNPNAADLLEIQAHQDKNPMKIEVVVPSGSSEMRFPGVVNFIDNEVELTTSTILLRGTLQNPKMYLIPGVHVTVYLYFGVDPNAILIPAEAVIQGQGIHFVYVVGKDNKVEKRIVKLESMYKGQQVISSGLQANDYVITDALQFLKPGEDVKYKVVSVAEVIKKNTYSDDQQNSKDSDTKTNGKKQETTTSSSSSEKSSSK